MLTRERSTTSRPGGPPQRPGPRQALFVVYAWAIVLALILPLWVAVVLLPRLAWRWALVRGASRLLLRLLRVPVAAEGHQRLATCAPCVIVANHASWADPMLLAATLPGRFVFTPTRGFTRNFASRVFMARLGSLFVGGRGGDAERIASLVQGGRSVVVFPEGGVYPGAGLRPFRTGAFVAAVEAQVPVSPVAIRGSRRLFDHHQWLPRWSPIAVQVLPPLHPDGTGPDAVERLREAARGAIAGHVDEPLVEA